MTDTPPIISVRGLTKAYPGVVALSALDLEIYAGEAHAIVGLNGAGKSTLVKVLAGIVRHDLGTVGLHDTAAEPVIRVVPQDVLLVPGFSVGRNVLLGREKKFVRRRLSDADRKVVSDILERLSLDISPDASIASCSPQELRLIQIAKALAEPCDVLLLDEPTATLPESDAERVVRTLASLRDQGEAVLYVSHRIGEVLRLADRITVLRDGKKAATFLRGEVDRQGLIETLSKNTVTSRLPDVGPAAEQVVLALEGFAVAGCEAFDLRVRAGEVVALVGVQEAGQSAVVQALAGLLPVESGSVEIAGDRPDIGNPTRATRAGLVLVPADRRRKGIVPRLDVRDNIALSPRSATRPLGLRDRVRERNIAKSYLNRFSIKAPSIDSEVEILSGGNQQKVALAKAIEAHPNVLLLDEPTQGIDVATKREILGRIKLEARASGRPVIAASSELEEIPSWADRVLVFRQGRVVATLEGPEVNEERLLQHAVP